MSVPGNNLTHGSFISNGTAQQIDLRFLPDKIEFTDQTNLFAFDPAAPFNPGKYLKGFWETGMPLNSFFSTSNDNGLATLTESFLTVQGVVPFDSSAPPFVPSVHATAISQAANALVTTATNHNLNPGDLVRITQITGMTQIGGMVFTVSATPSATTFRIHLDSSGFAAPATSATVQKIFADLYSPDNSTITKIVNGFQTTITLATADGLTVGQEVRILVPVAFGSQLSSEINQIQAQIVAVGLAANTITVDVDSTSFGAFAFPASGGPAFTFAQIVPIGEQAGGNLFDATTNIGFQGVIVGSNVVGAIGDVIQWVAYKAV